MCLSFGIHYSRCKDIKNILYLQIIPAEIVPICQLVHTFHQFIAFQPLPHQTTPPFGRVAKYNRRTGVNGLNRRLRHYIQSFYGFIIDVRTLQNKGPHLSEANEYHRENIHSLLSLSRSHATTADNERMAHMLLDHQQYESILLYRSTIF